MAVWTHNAVQQVGVVGAGRVRCALHLLGQVTGAVQGVSGGPLEHGLLAVKEQQLQRQVRAGALVGEGVVVEEGER